MEEAERQEDLATIDAASNRTAPHEPVEESTTRRDNLDSREANPDRVSRQHLVKPTEGGDYPCVGEAASRR